MNIKNIMYNRIKIKLNFKEKILLKLFKDDIIHIYRIGFNDGFYFKR